MVELRGSEKNSQDELWQAVCASGIALSQNRNVNCEGQFQSTDATVDKSLSLAQAALSKVTKKMQTDPVEEGAASVMWAATLPDTGPTDGFFRDCSPLHGNEFSCYSMKLKISTQDTHGVPVREYHIRLTL